jgi:hypothetical protein
MNPNIKAQWVEALRSGEYQQGSGMLKYYDDEIDEARFCCLGVLCDILGHEPGVDQQYPSGSVLDEVGLLGSYAKVLAHFNDKGDSFEQIADYIQENL